MASTILEVLEFTRVRELLAERCQFSLSVERALELGPTHRADIVRYLLNVTAEAVALLERRPEFTVGGVKDIRDEIERAGIGSVLPPSDLLEVLDTVAAARGLRRAFLRIEERGTDFPHLNEFVGFVADLPGLLYNSDLLMYDRKTDGLWSQITGHAVAGELTGTRLEFYPSEIITWGAWKATYPDSEVLTRETGHQRNYDVDPYGDYYFDDRLLFPANSTSDLFDALRLKDDVTGIEVDGPVYGAFLDEDVREVGVVNEVVGDTPVVVFADPTAGDNILVFERTVGDRELTFSRDDEGLVDEETGTRWSFDGLGLEGELAGTQLVEIIPVKGFWFAWVAFHPNTELWTLPEE